MLSELLYRLLSAELDLGFGKPILWREIVGNGFGLASAILGMRRRVAAWPIGIIGNILLFTVFLGATFYVPQGVAELDRAPLYGQAGRQIFFFAVSVYGWIQWARYRNLHADEGSAGVQPRWASARQRLALLGAAIVLWVVFYFVLKALGSWGAAADAWILTGSVLATYGMARGFTEFWLIWIAVDVVGVPLLLNNQYYPTALMYVIYGVFCIFGFVSWFRLERDRRSGPDVETTLPAEVPTATGRPAT